MSDREIMSSLEQLFDSLNDFYIQTITMIEECEAVVTRLAKHHTDCRIARTTGTAVGSVGSVTAVVGLALIPVTAGISTVVTLAGGVTSVLGGLTNCGTDIADYFITKRFVKRLKVLAKQRDESVKQLDERYNHFVSFKHKTNNPFNLIAKALSIAKLCRKIAYKIQDILSFTKDGIQLINGIINFTKINTRLLATDEHLGSGFANVTLSICSGANAGTKAAKVAIPMAGRVAFDSTVAAVGIVINGWEVYSLVKGWDKNHPTVDNINELVKELDKDIDKIQTTYKLIISSLDVSQELTDDVINDKIINSIDIQSLVDEWEILNYPNLDTAGPPI